MRGASTRMELVASASAANRQPAVAMHERMDDGGLVLHRLIVLDVRDGRIARMDAFPADVLSRG